jgi:LCP family protein required for cell wall assembly
MIEDELRAAFARHEPLTPAAGPVRSTIDRLVVRRRRRRLAVRAAGAAVAVLVTASVAPMALTARQAVTDAVLLPAPGTARPAGGPLTLLLLGLDRPADGVQRADTVLIMHVPADRRSAYLIAVPRDTGMQIPGRGFDKINQAFAIGAQRGGGRAGGAALTRDALSGATGITFDGTVTADYAALRKVTDALGGVRLCLPEAVRSVHTRRTYPAGCARFDGAMAVDLVRQRYGMANGSYDRDRNGQRLVKALVGQATDGGVLTDPVMLSRLLVTAGSGLSVDTGLVELIGATRGIAAADVVAISAPGFSPQAVGGLPYERLYPGVADGLFAALREDRLDAWVRAHPRYVSR